MVSLKRWIWNRVPAFSPFVYSLCKHYVDRYNGQNNHNIEENGELRLLQLLLPHCTTVFDVGANVGNWSALALKINPRLKIHCFEPGRAAFEQLQERGGAIFNNLGLSSEPAEMKLWIFTESATTNSLYKRQGLEDGWGLSEPKQAETVRLDTVDAYCQRLGITEIDLMKVDVEGHELEVFKGAAAMLAQSRIKRVQFEYGGCDIDARVLLKDFFEMFSSYGYTLHKIFPDGPRPVHRYDQRLENFQNQNWLAVARDQRVSTMER
jgi:FkbM family methyltransferase